MNPLEHGVCIMNPLEHGVCIMNPLEHGVCIMNPLEHGVCIMKRKSSKTPGKLLRAPFPRISRFHLENDVCIMKRKSSKTPGKLLRAPFPRISRFHLENDVCIMKRKSSKTQGKLLRAPFPRISRFHVFLENLFVFFPKKPGERCMYHETKIFKNPGKIDSRTIPQDFPFPRFFWKKLKKKRKRQSPLEHESPGARSM